MGITTLSGNNAFMLQDKLKSIKSNFIAKHGDIAVEKLDCEEVDYDRVRESLESLPFLASEKLVVLRNPSYQKEFVENAENLITNMPKTTNLIIHEPKIDKRTVYYKFLRKNTDYQEFNELDSRQLANWLMVQAKKQGSKLNLTDANYLVERIGSNQSLLFNELQKLISYNRIITKQTVDFLCQPSPKSTIFELLDAAFAGQHKRLLNLYKEQRQLKVEPQQIIAMLSWQLHVLALIISARDKSESEIITKAKLSPYTVSKSMRLSDGLSTNKIMQLVTDLSDLDMTIKTEPVDSNDLLQSYLLAISS